LKTAPATKYSSELRPIKIQSAPQAVAEAIREAITVGTLRPGQRLIEQKLAASFGIGQPTLREALKELEYQGFVNKIPLKGTYIATFDKNDCRELLEVRMNLEVLAIERAALKMTRATENELSKPVEGMRIAAEAVDARGFRRCDTEFHRNIAALANNRRLARTLELIVSQMLVYGTIGRKPDSREAMVAGAKQHKRILTALATGDPSKARRAFVTQMLQHWNENYQLDLQEDALTSSVIIKE